jgi:anti-sigma factor RsiW
MKCEHWRDRLEEWLDGDLAEDDRAGMEAHLGGCPACARHLDERRRLGADLKKSLHGLTADLHFQPPPAAGLLAKGRLPVRPRGLPFKPGLVAALAASLLIVLLFFFQPWTRLRQEPAAGKPPITVITVDDSLDSGEESFISGRINGSIYLIHLQISAVEKNGHS